MVDDASGMLVWASGSCPGREVRAATLTLGCSGQLLATQSAFSSQSKDEHTFLKGAVSADTQECCCDSEASV